MADPIAKRQRVYRITIDGGINGPMPVEADGGWDAAGGYSLQQLIVHHANGQWYDLIDALSPRVVANIEERIEQDYG